MPHWTFNNNHQAQQEFTKKERALNTGILVLIDQIIYHYAWTNLTFWHE